MKFFELFMTFALVLVMIGCKSKSEQVDAQAVVTLVRGSVSVRGAGQDKDSLRVGDGILSGQTITTGQNSTLILNLGEGQGDIELQSNSRFRLQKKQGVFELFLEQGSVWTKAGKLKKNEGIRLATEISVAAVRGTKFFTLIKGEMIATCHCQGQIEYQNSQSQQKYVNEEDYFLVQQGKKTIMLTAKDLQAINLPYEHNHSELADSKLGPKFNMTVEQQEKFFGLIREKLAEIP